jgi:hypothetical protein
VRNRIVAIACVAVLAVPSFARAEKGVLWAAGSIGFHTYAMGDVNDDIHSINAFIAPLNMEDIKSGLGLGGAVGMDYPRFSVAVSYERLKGKSDVSDVSGNVEYRVPANLFLAEGVYRLPTNGSFGLGLGAGIGIVSATGELDITVPSIADETLKLDGSSAAFALFATGTADVYKHVAVVPSIGYRYAKVATKDDSSFHLDYSGLMTKVMVRFTL